MSQAPPATIVVVNDFAHVQGGASKVALDEAVALAARGLRVILFSAVGPVSPPLEAAGVQVICLEQPQLLDVARDPAVAFQGLWNRRAHQAMRTLLESLDPDSTILHLHGWTKALSASPIRAAERAGFSMICTLHDFFTACPNGTYFDYVATEPCGRVPLGGACVTTQCDKRSPLHKAYRVARQVGWRRLGHLPGAIGNYIPLSRRSEKVLGPYLPPGARMFRVPHEIDVTRRSPADAAASDAVVCVGRLDEEKGVRLLAGAAARLQRPITFVGDGPLKAELESIPGMSVTGWLAPAEVQAWLDRARLLAFPSLWYETYGLVVDEAASRGVAALVSDVSAPAERVTDGVDGWVFTSGDEDALVSALDRAMSGDAAVRAGARAYERFWRARDERPEHADALLAAYTQVLAARPD